ncbi:unnamed protein product [Arctogadus glacialis]
MLPKIVADATLTPDDTPASPAPPPLPPEVSKYKNVSKSSQARKAHRANILKQQPDTLRTDLSGTGGKASINNLLMFTENTEAWHEAICTHYSHHKKRGICSGRQIVIEETDSDPPFTVNIYHNGTVMFQGSQASLSSINQNFNTIKSLTGTTNQTPTDINNNTEIETTQEEESCSTLESTVALLRQSLSLQEVELVELKERLNNSSQQQQQQQQQQQLEEQRSLLGAEFRASLLELRGEVKELQQDREEMRRGLTAVKEELLLKDQTIENLTKQIERPQEKTTPKQSETPPINLNLTTTPQPIPTITNTTTPPTNKKKPKIPTDADIIILIDSNGKFVNEEQLFPGEKVCKVWCPTTDTALELLTEPTLESIAATPDHPTSTIHHHRLNTAPHPEPEPLQPELIDLLDPPAQRSLSPRPMKQPNPFHQPPRSSS